MIRKLIDAALGKPHGVDPSRPRIIPAKRHGIHREDISAAALWVTEQLQQAGFSAFIVGGALRDLIVGIPPKDFDVATDATPEQVHALFRRSRIIGRRFQIVHVMKGDIIEVSTFRRAVPEQTGEIAADERGRIISDNAFGTQPQDAVRRDFTINALYYDPCTEMILDYVGGVEDIERRLLRVIGDPQVRFREDPVRMLRAVRLSAKLDFQIETITRSPIASMAHLLNHVPAARVFDEMLKLLLSGHAREGITRLRSEGLHHGILPMLDMVLEQPLGQKFVDLALINTDIRIREGKSVSPGFLFATLFWHDVLSAWNELQARGEQSMPALFQAMDEVMDNMAEKLAIPRRFGTGMKEIWGLQPRFENRSGNKPSRLLAHPRFRAGYDFLLLRCQSGEVDAELGRWWESFQSASEHDRKLMLLHAGPARRRKRRRSPSAGQGK
ncbi:MAG TPA: polynucleotide adenylyltransferase PcnB [Burkholderiales bacterium]|nr:polynucleotide adenylyltransferase PcnB [Burkholderiales bacterium]